MAKISAKNIELKDDERLIFGTDDDAYLEWDQDGNQMEISTVISGVDPTQDYHLTTRDYTDTHLRTQPIVSTAATNGQIVVWSGSQWELGDHGSLAGLSDDDHPQYVLVNGSRGFTGVVNGIYPVADDNLITKKYLFDVLTASASGTGEGAGFNVVYGSEFQYIQDDTESQTNSTTYQEKLNLTLSGVTGYGIPAGDYRIAWSYEWRQSKQYQTFWGRIQLDDSETLFEREISPFVDISFWNVTTMFYYYPAMPSGVHTVCLDYKTSDVGTVSYIRHAKIEFWRVI
jgi:hypothetical protein